MTDSMPLTRLWVDRATLGFGVHIYACFAHENPGPLGFVWGISFGAGNAEKTRFETFGSYVVPWARRRGVRSKINDQIRAAHDVITTQSGSRDGGLAFLRASGYTMSSATGMWHLAKRKGRHA